jgi:hypothetical protein
MMLSLIFLIVGLLLLFAAVTLLPGAFVLFGDEMPSWIESYAPAAVGMMGSGGSVLTVIGLIGLTVEALS